jgi:hypothetical protein
MGGSGFRSALGATVGLSSRWEAGSMLQRACGAMSLGGLYGGDVGILYGPGIPGDAFRLLCGISGGLLTSIGP